MFKTWPGKRDLDDIDDDGDDRSPARDLRQEDGPIVIVFRNI